MRILRYKILPLFFLLINCGFANAPSLINYQGVISTDNDHTISRITEKSMAFTIHDAPTNGNLIWGPQFFDRVPVVHGRFNVILGTTDSTGRSIAEAFTSDERYISVWIGDPGTGHADLIEVSPRQRVVSTPYAIAARKSDFAAYADHAATADHAETANTANTVAGANLHVDPTTGNVGIGTPQPSGKLDVNGNIRIRSGGLTFPDGSVMTSVPKPAATGSLGTFTQGVKYYNDRERKILVVAYSKLNNNGVISGLLGTTINGGFSEVAFSENNGPYSPNSRSITFVVPPNMYWMVTVYNHLHGYRIEAWEL